MKWSDITVEHHGLPARVYEPMPRKDPDNTWVPDEGQIGVIHCAKEEPFPYLTLPNGHVLNPRHWFLVEIRELVRRPTN